MFPFPKSEYAKLREHAKNWLYVGNKVYHFRKDQMSDSDVTQLLRQLEEVNICVKAGKDGSERLKASMGNLREHLEQVGGNYYPRTAMAENVEFFFAAIIIYVGFTAFFMKPFKIPTNSMWPTYYGMTAEVYKDADEAPGSVVKGARFVGFGATHFEVVAPADGELLVPVLPNGAYFTPPAKVRRYFVIPAGGKEWMLKVGGETVSFKTPEDFSAGKQVYDQLLSKDGGNYAQELYDRTQRKMVAGKDQFSYTTSDGRSRTSYITWVRTGKFYKKGESILSFDLMTGDQLFVDRMAYHFVSPKVGDGFVFKTGLIPAMANQPESFYIKRLSGTPGDVVQVKRSGLFVNGEPATGSVAFNYNAEQQGLYTGYLPKLRSGSIDLSTPQTVPEELFLALGDNSSNSSDSRAWGYVPKDSVVGRPIMIYFPFTNRFGIAE